MRVRAEDENGDMQFGYGANDFLVNSAAAVAQLVQNRLGLKTGEWFLDTTAGTPWFQQVLGTVNNKLYDFAVQEVVLNTDGVSSISAYWSARNSNTRNLSIAMSISTIFDPISVSTTLS
jgi:hypothetical protein